MIKSMTKKQRKSLYRIIAAGVLALAAALVPAEGITRLLLFAVPYVIVSFDILKKAAINIKNGQVFDENFLMAVASLGAFVLGKCAEGTAVMIFYQIGELFESCAVERSRKNISDLMDICPEYANLELEDGSFEQVDPDEVEVGSIIVVRPGEKIPIDGIITEGKSVLNTAALTGESLPRDVEEGSEVISGCINLTGLLRVTTTKLYEDSTVSRILELVEDSSMRKARTENFITIFAKYYTPAVCGAALLLALIPPVVSLQVGGSAEWATWIIRGLTFLVISCPCALVISIPLGFFGGIGGASSKGILVKGSNYLEALSKVTNVVFDKTGTLTKGEFSVTEVCPSGVSPDFLLETAAYCEYFSDHPVSRCIKDKYGKDFDAKRLSSYEEVGGHGVTVCLDGLEAAAGNIRLMKKAGIEAGDGALSGTQVHVALDGKYIGYILVEDTLKTGAAETVSSLKSAGIKVTVLTGDSEGPALKVGKALGADRVEYNLLPGDKVEKLEEIIQSASPKEKTAFVGDGINDAPVLVRADVGAAMGALGSDAAIEAADIVLMDDDPRKFAEAIRISKKTMKIVYENIFMTLGVKGACLVLGAAGIAGMWAAIFADVGIMIIAVLNSMRMLIKK